MQTSDDESHGARQRIFARLAVLQRLEDEARSSGRPAMLQSIRQLMDHELAALQALGGMAAQAEGLPAGRASGTAG